VVTVMIVDEEVFFRVGLCQVLSRHHDFKILDCDPAQAPLLEAIEANLPDVILLGSDLHAHSALALARTITRYYPNTKVVMLSPSPDDEELFEVIKTAAVACLSKTVSADELIGTIRRAYRGEYPINDTFKTRPTVARRVLKQFEYISSMGEPAAAVIAPLTSRERQILNYVAEGNTNKEIGHKIGISEHTVKCHVSGILRKLNANDRAQAVAIAMRHYEDNLSTNSESRTGL